MGNFAKVDWTGGAEVTSQKLQQMSDNDEWLKKNALVGRTVFPQNSAGKVANGRKRGTVAATRIEAIAYPFDSGSGPAVRYLEVRVPLQPVFTTPPVVFPVVYTPFAKLAVKVLRVGGTKYVDLALYTVDNAAGRLNGEVNLLAIGS